MCSQEKPTGSSQNLRKAGWCCAGIVITVAIGVRAWNLRGMPITFDEFHIGLAFLQAPGLRAYIAAGSLLGPGTLSLYQVFEYLCGHMASNSLLAIRVGGALLGAAAAALVCLSGRRLYGNRAAILAGLLAALSPMLVWHGQTARPYALLNLMGAISMYTLIRAWHGDSRRWWTLNVLANLLIVSTHVYGILAVCTEIFFILVFGRKRLYVTGFWCALKAAASAAAFLTVFRTPLSYASWGAAGFVRGFVCPLVCNDVANWNTDIAPRWPLYPVDWTSFRTWGDLVLPLLCGVALLQALVGFGAAALRGQESRETQVRSLPALFAVLPVTATFFLAEFVNFGNEAPRYTIFSLNGLYVVLAGWVCSKFGSRASLALGFLLVVLYGYQLHEMVGRRTRPDWIAAGALIAKEASPLDVAIGTGYAGVQNILEDMAPELVLPMVGADSLRSACDAVLYFLSLTEDATAMAPTNRAVWLVIDTGFDRSQLSALESAFEDYGLSSEVTRFLGGENLHVYKIRQAASAGAADVPVSVDLSAYYNRVDVGYVCNAVMSVLPEGNALKNDPQRVYGLLDRICVYFGGDWTDMLWWSLASLEYGQPALAEALVENVTPKRGGPMREFVLGCIKAYRGEVREARAHFDQAAEFWAIRVVYGGLMQEVTKPDNLQAALVEVDNLETLGLTYTLRGLRAMCHARYGQDEPVGLPLPVGVYIGRQHQAEELDRMMSCQHWKLNNSPAQLYALGRMFDLLGDTDMSAFFFGRLAEVRPDPALLPQWNATSSPG